MSVKPCLADSTAGSPEGLHEVPFVEEFCFPFLLRAQNADGGWGYMPGSASGAEPTCWALMALHGVSNDDASEDAARPRATVAASSAVTGRVLARIRRPAGGLLGDGAGVPGAKGAARIARLCGPRCPVALRFLARRRRFLAAFGTPIATDAGCGTSGLLPAWLELDSRHRKLGRAYVLLSYSLEEPFRGVASALLGKAGAAG